MRLLGLASLLLLLAAASLFRGHGRAAAEPPAVRDPVDATMETGTAAERSLVGCRCRREVVDTNEGNSLWICEQYTCATTCTCFLPAIVYEVHPAGMSPGLCDTYCTSAGCTKLVSNSGSAVPAATASRSFRLDAPQAPGGDDVVALAFPTGAKSDNKHVSAANAKDGWFVEVGDRRLRLFQLEFERPGRDGKPVTVRRPVGYETTPGPEKQGQVDFVRRIEAADLTGDAPVLTTIEGFYEVGVRRSPDAPVEIYTVHTANSLAVTP